MHVLQAMQQTKALSWPLFHGLENIFCLTEDLQGQVNAFWKKKKSLKTPIKSFEKFNSCTANPFFLNVHFLSDTG